MRLGIDLDGVVCDFAVAANNWLADRLEVEAIAIDRWDWYKGYGEDVEVLWDQLWNVEVPERGFFRLVEPIYGAHKGLTVLREAGHTLVFCTARPMCGAVDTEAWLEDFGFGGHPLFVTASAKAKVHMGVDLLLDDKGETVRRHLVQAQRQAVLFKQPWNVEDWGIVPSVTGWDEFVTLVEAQP